MLGFVHLESPGLPAQLPASVQSLRLESCTGMGASAGLLAPMVLHCCYTRRLLQVRPQAALHSCTCLRKEVFWSKREAPFLRRDE